MKAYSMDLRERVLKDADAGLKTGAIADKYSVSPAWVRRLKQRRAATGEVAPRQQRHGPLAGWVTHAERIREAVREAREAREAPGEKLPSSRRSSDSSRSGRRLQRRSMSHLS